VNFPLPRALPAGATIGICAPSGLVPEPAALDRAAAHLRQLGYRVVLASGIDAREGYFAGSTAQRLAGLHQLVRNPAIDLVMAARGGFGLSHLLPHIDWQACAESGKLFCGFSDFTAFHLGLYARTGQVSIAGPMACSDLAGDSTSTLHAEHVWGLLTDGRRGHSYPVCTSEGPLATGSETGVLWGGNLSLLAHLVGTPWFPQIDGGLLFIEDLAEAPYRIERMLMQLELSGVLARQRAILVGHFTACDPVPGAPANYLFTDVLSALRTRFDGPVLTGLPFGHVRDKIALPFGALARVAQDGEHWQLHVEAFAA
jgi:muramoyltetrapeptide carboxypeptidase